MGCRETMEKYRETHGKMSGNHGKRWKNIGKCEKYLGKCGKLCRKDLWKDCREMLEGKYGGFNGKICRKSMGKIWKMGYRWWFFSWGRPAINDGNRETPGHVCSCYRQQSTGIVRSRNRCLRSETIARSSGKLASILGSAAILTPNHPDPLEISRNLAPGPSFCHPRTMQVLRCWWRWTSRSGVFSCWNHHFSPSKTIENQPKNTPAKHPPAEADQVENFLKVMEADASNSRNKDGDRRGKKIRTDRGFLDKWTKGDCRTMDLLRRKNHSNILEV